MQAAPPKSRIKKGNAQEEARRDRQAIEQESRRLARESILSFTAYTDPNYRFHWHNEMLGRYLDRFIRGEIKRLIISMPPRSGKSELVSLKMPAYILGKNPKAKILAASHTADLAKAFSRKVQRLIMSPAYRELFPNTGLKDLPPADLAGASREWVQTDAEFDVVGYGDNYRCAGVGGGIAGKGGDYIIVDDPIKNRKDAESQKFRDDLWEWYLDDLETRDEGGAGILIMATRWHDDDLTGRLIKSQRAAEANGDNEEDDETVDEEKWIVLNLPAILEDEDDRFEDEARGERDEREVGATLWPWRWSGRRDDLPGKEMERRARAKLARRQRLNPYGFSALYQGRPTPRTGSTYDVTKIRIVDKPRARIVREVRYWDKAGTQDGGKRTAGVRMALLADKSFLFQHVLKGQWAAGPREKNIKDTAEADGKKVTIVIEQEPGSGGKESAESTVSNLIGYTVKIDKVTGSKELRADPLSTQIDANNVEMLRGDWNQPLKDELRAFPRGTFKDQADASAGAFNTLAAGAGVADFDDLIKD